MDSIQKIARVLRTDQDVIRALEEKAEVLTGKKNVMDKIAEENGALIEERLQLHGFGAQLSAQDIYDALVNKIKEDDLELYKAMGKPSFIIQEDVDFMLKKIEEIRPLPQGFFLKKDKAAQILRKVPPEKVIKYLGYRDVDELLTREDIFEIYAAVRLFDDREWLSAVFAGEYTKLTPEDFEKRPIIIKSLPQKWVGIAQHFLAKKYQNISHLKELGFIFAAPTALGILGETTRLFTLALHYIYEVQFYSAVLENLAADPATFALKTIRALRVDILDKRLPESQRLAWMILPSYVAKYDENDWRLFEPHISSEALFWIRSESDLMKIKDNLKDVYADFSFWSNLDWVGDYFKVETGAEILVSFNLVDTLMSLIKEKDLIKYLYHHQESLWNKIFIEYFGEKELEDQLKKNIVTGWFSQ